MRIAAIGLLAATTLVAGCSSYGSGGGYGANSAYSQYDWNRPDPSYNGYDAGRYYRDDRRYRERQLSSNERVYRGQDGRYYCRRNDGTTGLIVGGVAGGVLGNVIAPGGSEVLGTVLGAALGAVAGNAVDRGSNNDNNRRNNNRDVRCR
ncbi:glycine zipper 2TM domain-containing protein [Sphingomonas sp. M1-B02]|uniref:glycine zipper 2TM domain-containing protein n=1 Tax=Sphingomonas sp. M1-B02 TaxID=3114300 RepID=UPI00223F3242|nr:glycine zipper 2TM domain-containing protein [Sphingomonas sp. S6-11]UZK65963.1 glycine zipper 2TM domain-containing protein [Sphingomonas sp. S6-11]